MTTGGAWFVMQKARRTGGGFDPPPWLRVVLYLCLAVLVGLLVFMAGLLVTGCGGPAFEPGALEASPIAISPVSDGGLSEDPLAGSDGAHSPGLDATDAGEFGGGDAGVPDEGITWEASPPPLDHLSDPWPADVVVEPMPAPNCFVDFAGHDSCCRAVNQPPVKCEIQQSPHFCVSCPK